MVGPRPPGAIFFLCDAGWSSLVARRAHNPKVAGSNPAPATREVAGQSLPSREGSLVPDEMSLLGSADQLVNFGKLFVQVLFVQALFDRA
jgi:hypothetical protein